ncbi:MAG: tetratricopeptide repeat protein [Bacteroidetes bacterium]|nr:tetratricopeptide repeat protein [Bacteroidota bacterium]
MKKWMIMAIMAVLAIPGRGEVDPYLAGRACMIQKKYDSALVHLNRALEIEPGESHILMNLGICHFQLNQNPEAKEAFYEAERRQEALGSLYLAKTEVRLMHPELALKYLRIHLSSRFRLHEKDILLDPELSQLEGTPGWQQLWNEKDWYKQSDQEFQEAQFLKENGDALEAINILNKLEKQNYRRTLVYAEKAEVYAMLGNSKATRSALQSAVKSDVRNLDAVMGLSYLQVESGELEEASKGLNRVIRQEPDRFNAYLLRATARSKSGNLDGALKDLELYLAYFPDQHEIIYQRGLIQYEHRKYLDAIHSFNRALEMDKSRAAYYFARGLTYASTGTTRYAERDMSMALDLDPYNGEIWFEKGKLSEKMGDVYAACLCFRKAFQYGIFEAGDFIDQSCN